MSDSEYVIPINNLPVYFYLTDPNILLEESLGPPPVSNPELRRTFRYYGSFSQDPDIVKVVDMNDKCEKNRKLCRINTMCNQNNSKGTWYHVELMKPNNHQNLHDLHFEKILMIFSLFHVLLLGIMYIFVSI